MHKYIVQRREEDAKAQVIRAEGDGIAAELVANATMEYGSALVTLRKLEAAKEIAQELQGSPNVTFLSGNTLNMLNIPAGGRSGMGL
jgi:prohibitin 1